MPNFIEIAPVSYALQRYEPSLPDAAEHRCRSVWAEITSRKSSGSRAEADQVGEHRRDPTTTSANDFGCSIAAMVIIQTKCPV
jgi:hypothetical protein